MGGLVMEEHWMVMVDGISMSGQLRVEPTSFSSSGVTKLDRVTDILREETRFREA